MACNDCNDNNPCVDPCNDCVDSNPCYETGCLNPTTFECLTKPGLWPNMGVTDDMTGKEVLEAINTSMHQLEINMSNLENSGGSSEDKFVGVTVNDSTPHPLNSKITEGLHIKKTVTNSGGNEKLALTVTPETMISKDDDNILSLDSKKLLKVSIPSSGGKHYAEGDGIKFSDGDGTPESPILINLETSGVIAKRECFDGEWRDLTLNTVSNPNVSVSSGAPKFRYRYDGSIEFKGSLVLSVKFGPYSSGNSHHTVTIGSLPTNCISAPELQGQGDLKSISYIDNFQPSGDLISQQYNYVIRKTNQNIVLVFQSSFSTETTKTIIVSFDGAISHPNI